MKWLIINIISQICYSRELFQVESYEENGILVPFMKEFYFKTIRCKSKCKEANELLSDIKFALRALDEKLLKTLSIIFQDETSPQKEILEAYTFKFGTKGKEYGDNNVHNYLDNTNFREKNLAFSTKELFENVRNAMKSLKPLDRVVSVRIKAEYHDDLQIKDDFSPVESRCMSVSIA